MANRQIDSISELNCGAPKVLRIGIDAHILGKQKGGVETYVLSAIRTLVKVDRQNEYFIYVTWKHPFGPGDLPPNFHLRILSAGSPWIQRSLLVPYVYQRDRLDVIHLQRAIPFWGCRHTVLNIHDATYVTHPHLFPAWRRIILTAIFRRSGRKASRVITGTQTAKEEIIRHFQVDASKVVVIPDGVDRSAFYRVSDRKLLDSAWKRFGIRPPYVIFLGAIERNKNLHVLIQAFAEFRRTCPEFMLVIVGKWRFETKRGYSEELKKLVRDLALEDVVIFTGYITEEERRTLLSGAAMLVFPSIAEGFGLPLLEAMACGVPAIAADIPVTLEVFGEAVLTAQANTPANLAEAMFRLAKEPELCRELVNRGYQKAELYSWEHTGRLLLETYRSAVEAEAGQP